MNCEEFAQRMDDCLDRRRSLDEDLALQGHAGHCQSCRLKLEAWSTIETVLPRTDGGPHLKKVAAEERPIRYVAALAAAIALLFIPLVLWSDSSPVEQRVGTREAEVTAVPPEAALAQLSSQADPTLWWQSVQDRDWVSQTMPTVKSVQQGVAPIGRSLMRAVTILTIGAQDRTS